jgi:hypothetical protein
MTSALGIWHWLLLVIILAAMVIPFWRILPRAGNPHVALAAATPP